MVMSYASFSDMILCTYIMVTCLAYIFSKTKLLARSSRRIEQSIYTRRYDFSRSPISQSPVCTNGLCARARMLCTYVRAYLKNKNSPTDRSCDGWMDPTVSQAKSLQHVTRSMRHRCISPIPKGVAHALPLPLCPGSSAFTCKFHHSMEISCGEAGAGCRATKARVVNWDQGRYPLQHSVQCGRAEQRSSTLLHRAYTRQVRKKRWGSVILECSFHRALKAWTVRLSDYLAIWNSVCMFSAASICNAKILWRSHPTLILLIVEPPSHCLVAPGCLASSSDHRHCYFVRLHLWECPFLCIDSSDCNTKYEL